MPREWHGVNAKNRVRHGNADTTIKFTLSELQWLTQRQSQAHRVGQIVKQQRSTQTQVKQI